MGYMFAIGECINCGVVLSFNPEKVPSVRINGKREPLCSLCHGKWNEIHRVSEGLEPVPIHPEAYEPEEVL